MGAIVEIFSLRGELTDHSTAWITTPLSIDYEEFMIIYRRLYFQTVVLTIRKLTIKSSVDALSNRAA